MIREELCTLIILEQCKAKKSINPLSAVGAYRCLAKTIDVD